MSGWWFLCNPLPASQLSFFGPVQVIATDEEQTDFMSTATVTILIRDVNDNSPKFLPDTYKLTVAENSPAGTTLQAITVSASLASW